MSVVHLALGSNVGDRRAHLDAAVRVLRPLREIKRYADDTLAAGLGIARNLDGADDIVRTRELASALPGLVRSAFSGGK